MMHPQGMMGQGFDPTYGAHMGRGGGYGGFSSHGPPFHGMIPSFPPVGTVGLPGVAPHVNPAFFGRGVTANGMGMMPSGGMEGHQTGMWADSGMGGWGGEEHNRRMRESSYGDDMGSEYGYNDMNHERGGRSSVSRDKERGTERDWGGSSDRRRRDDRETDWHRDRYREEKDGYMDQRQRERDWENEDDWEKERPSKSRSKSRLVEDEDQRPRSKEVDYGKRRRLQSELNE
jgi:cleavage and polyadenylation specificity factor subunit 6/7